MDSNYNSNELRFFENKNFGIPHFAGSCLMLEGQRVDFKRSRSLIRLATAFCVSENLELNREQIREVLGIKNYDMLSPRMKDSVNLRVLKQLSRLRKYLELKFSDDYFCVAFVRETDSWRLFVEKERFKIQDVVAGFHSKM